MSIASKFRFIGELVLPKDFERFYRAWKGGSSGNSSMSSISFGIRESSNNMAFTSLFGMERDIIKTRNQDNKNIDIKWADRLDPAVINQIVNYRKIHVDLGEELGGAQDFISELDAIEFLAEKLPLYKGKIDVRGNWKKRPYKGVVRDEYELSSVRAVGEEVVPKLQLTMDFFYNKDSIDDSTYDESKKIFIDGYVAQYVDKNIGIQYFPQRAVLSSAKYNMDNPKHAARWKNRKDYIDKLSSQNMYHLYWECRLINGAEEVEFDESMLTDRQREQVELGIRDLDYFRPKTAIYGTKTTEVRIFDAILTGEFAEGIIQLDEPLDEFTEQVFSFEPKQNKEDLLAAVSLVDDDDEESLF